MAGRRLNESNYIRLAGPAQNKSASIRVPEHLGDRLELERIVQMRGL